MPNINKFIYKNTKLTDASKKSKLQTAICLNLAVSSDFIKWCHDSSTCRVLYDTSTPDGLYGLLVSLGLSVHRNWIAFCATAFDRRQRDSNNGIRNIRKQHPGWASGHEESREASKREKEREKVHEKWWLLPFYAFKTDAVLYFSQQFLLNKHYFSSPAGRCETKRKRTSVCLRLWAARTNFYWLNYTNRIISSSKEREREKTRSLTKLRSLFAKQYFFLLSFLI